MTETQKIVSQKEVFERCLDIINDKDVEIRHIPSTEFYSAFYKDKELFKVCKYLYSLEVEIDDVSFDSFDDQNRNLAIDLFDKVVAKYVEQQQARNRKALNFLSSFALGNKAK